MFLFIQRVLSFQYIHDVNVFIPLQAKTLMFVNFSPADYNSDETATSLSYASRVKKIVNNASKQAESEEVMHCL